MERKRDGRKKRNKRVESKNEMNIGDRVIQ